MEKSHIHEKYSPLYRANDAAFPLLLSMTVLFNPSPFLSTKKHRLPSKRCFLYSASIDDDDAALFHIFFTFKDFFLFFSRIAQIGFHNSLPPGGSGADEVIL